MFSKRLLCSLKDCCVSEQKLSCVLPLWNTVLVEYVSFFNETIHFISCSLKGQKSHQCNGSILCALHTITEKRIFWLPRKILDWQKLFATGQKILHRQKNSQLPRKFLTDKEYSRPARSSRPPKEFSTHEKKSRKINMISHTVDLHLAWWNGIWPCYPKNWISKIISTTFVHYGFP